MIAHTQNTKKLFLTDFKAKETRALLTAREREKYMLSSSYMSLAMPSPSSDWLQNSDEGQLSVDVFRRGSTLVIRSAVAGIEPDDLAISIHDDLLTIRGTRRHHEELDEQDWFVRECYWGSFSRSVLLPEDVDENGIEATIKNGILEIRLPIRAQDRKIVIRSLDQDVAQA